MKNWKILLMLLCVAAVLTGCGLRTVDQLYCLPQRSDADKDLQSVIDKAMDGLSYCAPYGDNRQVTQKVDLDGDGIEECLVFAKDDSQTPLKILIFCQLASGYVLMDTIEGYGFAFDFVDYAQIDGQPGMEIIVGRQLSNDVMRAVSVYRFSSEISRQLMSASYSRMVTCDLDTDGVSELLVLGAESSQTDPGSVSLYRFEENQLQRTDVSRLSDSIDKIRRATVGKLQQGTQAIFVTGVTEDDTLVTDVFALSGGTLTKITSCEPVKTLDNRYLYPEDMDADGLTELPALVPMNQQSGLRQQYFVRWYCLDSAANQTDKLYMYTNMTNGWYMNLESQWLQTMFVEQTADTCSFYMWDQERVNARKIMTIYSLTDSDREEIVEEKGYMVLYQSDALICAAQLEPAAAGFGITKNNLPEYFRMMRTELNTDEDRG